MTTTTYDMPAAWRGAAVDLVERYRPQKLDEIVGQTKAVAEIRSWLADPARRRALWLRGDTGVGKTTAARIIASEFAEKLCVTEYDRAEDVAADELERIRDTMELFGWGKGGRVWIVNEAHGLRGSIIRAFLGILERVPQHCLFIFTTTRDGEGKLFDDYDDASPLLDRCECITFTTNGFAKPAAQRLREIAQAENADGEPESFYMGILKENGNSMRRALGVLEKRIRAKRTETVQPAEVLAC